MQFYSKQFKENVFVHLDFEGKKSFRTPFSNSLSAYCPIWNHSAKVDIENLEHQLLTIRVCTIIGRLKIVLGSVQLECRDLIKDIIIPVALFNSEKY